MSKTTFLFIILLAILAGALGYNYFYQPFKYLLVQNELDQQQAAEALPSPDLFTPQQLAATLTPEQKIRQLLAVPFVVREVSSASAQINQASDSAAQRDVTVDWVKQRQPGFVTLFGSRISVDQAINSIKMLTKNDSIVPGLAARILSEPLIVVDHEGGSVQRLNGPGFSLLPDWQVLCGQDEQTRLAALATSSAELRAVGVDIVFAPMLDLAQGHPILKGRSCGNNPPFVADRAVEFISAFENQDIEPVIKHFPGIGKTTKDLHTSFDSVSLATAEAQIYRSVLDRKGSVGVMVAHVGVTNQDANVPCTVSASCVNELKDAYPNVLLFTDALDMKSVYHQPSGQPDLKLNEVASKAILAGNNVLVFGPGISATELDLLVSQLTDFYHDNESFQTQVDRSLEKVLELKHKKVMKE